uniref:Uncharacterized protein n=2 Tax=Timema TaxID=61471 RepID=A0A7R9DXP4_TIMPO|nr:unnamed protein product [Timema douglasi]CAD7421708.1 unnamed protein product [Timema poppensis]
MRVTRIARSRRATLTAPRRSHLGTMLYTPPTSPVARTSAESSRTFLLKNVW